MDVLEIEETIAAVRDGTRTEVRVKWKPKSTPQHIQQLADALKTNTKLTTLDLSSELWLCVLVCLDMTLVQ